MPKSGAGSSKAWASIVSLVLSGVRASERAETIGGLVLNVPLVIFGVFRGHSGDVRLGCYQKHCTGQEKRKHGNQEGKKFFGVRQGVGFFGFWLLAFYNC